ncbi:N-(5'-phosphoribosyl)anthranilate isomerase TrpF [Gottschalkia acidurici 9a]|uniref:N-(5'-phosphoribosyl)anthranilate isomerase n=1 Tax=Gottschalkia acidurici (strain ATCC 7906 / DSM 604 / BCRC 14475 / CIP 104303 / KCTC 5404 / NCIMB 10678 / 9a) TaxID=1128398 RepID=K0AYA1_GOTA9|nr:phosphoribosylanthranilate isomerase [Gottschalkia acidurici]AFS77747.1 N-(5'-phosphoribosyl)anthranilate isomerase TrpF [Gottschalkia acidurici 9a]
MVKIKVCGIRRNQDIEYVNTLRPEYIGFIFAESKRKVTKEEAFTLKELLNKDIKTVGIFVNEDLKNVKDIANFVGLDIVQLHGDEDARYIDSLKSELINKSIWKAVRIKDENSLKDIEQFNVDGILLDTYSKEAYGGLGESFDWNIVRNLKTNKKVILAGGLNSDNVERGINKVRPDIIDVSSGVETDGYKDFNKMKSFIKKGRKL